MGRLHPSIILVMRTKTAENYTKRSDGMRLILRRSSLVRIQCHIMKVCVGLEVGRGEVMVLTEQAFYEADVRSINMYVHGNATRP